MLAASNSLNEWIKENQSKIKLPINNNNNNNNYNNILNSSINLSKSGQPIRNLNC